MQPSDSMNGKLPQGCSWYLLAETLLPGGVTNDDQEPEDAPALLIEAARELGLAPAQLSRIKGTLADAIGNAIKRNNLQGSNLPLAIRMYYQKDRAEHPRERETFRVDFAECIPNENGTGSTEVVLKAYEPETPADTGWGYFLTEKKVDFPGASCWEPTYLIELFLYKEEK